MSDKKVFLSVSAHVGDGALSAGPLLAQMALEGHSTYILDLTPGERGHPRMEPEAYKEQKLQEAQSFADAIGAKSIVFDDYTDGFLDYNDEVASRVAKLIREIRPNVVVAHWVNSIHTDHSNASKIAQRARYLAGLPGGVATGLPRYGVPQLLFAENWEDSEGFVANTYVPISDEAFNAWLKGISTHAFARGETYGFRYIDYYTALMTVRGALAGGAGFPRAVALADEPGFTKVVTDF